MSFTGGVPPATDMHYQSSGGANTTTSVSLVEDYSHTFDLEAGSYMLWWHCVILDAGLGGETQVVAKQAGVEKSRTSTTSTFGHSFYAISYLADHPGGNLALSFDFAQTAGNTATIQTRRLCAMLVNRQN